MVGMVEPVVGTIPPGEGKSGAMSGESTWYGGKSVENSERTLVAVFDDEELISSEEEGKDGEGDEGMNIIMMRSKRNQKEAMSNDEQISRRA